jgi:hypothetical protein
MMTLPMQKVLKPDFCRYKQSSACDLPGPSRVDKWTGKRVRFPAHGGAPVQGSLSSYSIGEQCAHFSAGERQVHRVKKPVLRPRRDGLIVQKRSGLLPLCRRCDSENQHTPEPNNGIWQGPASQG